MNRKTIATLVIFLSLSLFCISRSLYAQDEREATPSTDDQKNQLEEMAKQWEQVQESSPLIATMLIQSVTLLTMAEEKEISIAQLADIGKCFSGLLAGRISDRSCMIPMELVKLRCPCPDPRKDCNPKWFPNVYWKCVSEAIRCRIENNTICP